MKKILISVIAIVVVGAGGFYALNSFVYDEKQGYAANDYKDAEYIIDGERVRLKDGIATEEIAPGSASKKITRYFGNEVVSDLDDDGRDDVVFLLTQEGGGSGVFYYVVAALSTERGYVGSQGLFLGDRIAPQTTSMDEGKTALGTNRQHVIIVNYADRAPGEDFSIQPSVGKSIWLKLDPQYMQFGEVVQNFEGESNL